MLRSVAHLLMIAICVYIAAPATCSFAQDAGGDVPVLTGSPGDPNPIGDVGGSTSTGTQDSPEPATLTLLGLGGVGALWKLRRRKAAAA